MAGHFIVEFCEDKFEDLLEYVNACIGEHFIFEFDDEVP
jgi:hypothetical protein